MRHFNWRIKYENTRERIGGDMVQLKLWPNDPDCTCEQCTCDQASFGEKKECECMKCDCEKCHEPEEEWDTQP